MCFMFFGGIAAGEPQPVVFWHCIYVCLFDVNQIFQQFGDFFQLQWQFVYVFLYNNIMHECNIEVQPQQQQQQTKHVCLPWK